MRYTSVPLSHFPTTVECFTIYKTLRLKGWFQKKKKGLFFILFLLVFEKTELISGQYGTLSNPDQNKIVSGEQILQFQIRGAVIYSRSCFPRSRQAHSTWFRCFGAGEIWYRVSRLLSNSWTWLNNMIHDSLSWSKPDMFTNIDIGAALKQECTLDEPVTPPLNSPGSLMQSQRRLIERQRSTLTREQLTVSAERSTCV